MALKDMTLTKAEAKEESCAPDASEAPRYPYCLCLYLDDEVLKKLGMDRPAVGTELALNARVIVTGTSERQTLEGEGYQSVDLQITAMDLMQSVTTEERTSKAAGKLYG